MQGDVKNVVASLDMQGDVKKVVASLVDPVCRFGDLRLGDR